MSAPNLTAWTMRLARLWAAYNSPTGTAAPSMVARISRTYAPAPDMLADMLQRRGVEVPPRPAETVR